MSQSVRKLKQESAISSVPPRVPFRDAYVGIGTWDLKLKLCGRNLCLGDLVKTATEKELKFCCHLGYCCHAVGRVEIKYSRIIVLPAGHEEVSSLTGMVVHSRIARKC